MNVCSLAFLAFCCLASISFRLLPPKKTIRQGLLSVVNAAFLFPFVPNVSSWIWFTYFIAATYVILRTIRPGNAGRQLGLALGIIVVSFIVLKGYLPAWLGAPSGSTMSRILSWVSEHDLRPVELVGLSYMLFKFIHMAVDRWQDQLAPFDFITYVNYQLSFFTLVAGPIQRYNDFYRCWDQAELPVADARPVLLAWSRILSGMIKMGAIAPIVHEMFEQARGGFEAQPAASLLARFAVFFYGYPIYLYFNFSGYTDVAIGSAKLLGFELPENFNRPFLARNVIDFWDRWHITLTHWIRDYVFMASYKAAAERFSAARGFFGYGLLFCAFLLAGVWHGVSAGFAVFGVIHGLGAVLSRAFGEALKGSLGRAGVQIYLKSNLVHALAIFVTFHFVCFSFIFFASGEMALRILNTVYNGLLSPVNLGPSFHLGLRPTLSLVPWLLAAVQPPVQTRASALYKVVLLKTILVVLLFCWLWVAEQRDPVVVYMRF